MSIQNILGNKMRSFLTVLGIIIGVAAVIALITTVQSVTGEVLDQFAALGTGKITINASGTPLKRGLSESDLLELAQVDNVSGISPTLTFTANTVYEGVLQDKVTVEGRGYWFFVNNPDAIGRGRAINSLDVENRNRVCVVDNKIQQTLFPGIDPLDRTILINNLQFTIVGVLDESAMQDAMSQAMGGSRDGKLIIPYTTAMKVSGLNGITSVEVFIEDTDFTDQVIADAEVVLSRAFNYKDDSFRVINLESLLDTMNTMMGMMTTMLAGIASIALLVGGIGIMNMMLVSVTERTTEIGLRKAIGARPGSIQQQFLLESIVLSLIGGVIGIIVGLSISALLAMVMDTAFTIFPSAIALGVGFSGAVGIIFGWMPARKASKLNPIDALRSV